MPSFTKQFSRFLIVLSGAALGLTLSATAASANPNAACDGTHHSDSGHGANVRGAYDETCDGSPSGNGNGGGTATGKPCAGCVGNADDKNPKGQASDGHDHNAGYECDRNHGVARTNPAHTGCASNPPSTGGGGGSITTTTPKAPVTTTPPACPAGSTMIGGACVSGESLVKPPADPGLPAHAAFDPPSRGRTLVLGAQYLRSFGSTELAFGEQARSIGSLATTGSTAVDQLPLGLALVALGTLVARFGRSRKPAEAS